MNIIETNLKFGTLSKRSSTKRIILHHAAMNGSVEAVHNVHRAKDGLESDITFMFARMVKSIEDVLNTQSVRTLLVLTIIQSEFVQKETSRMKQCQMHRKIRLRSLSLT